MYALPPLELAGLRWVLPLPPHLSVTLANAWLQPPEPRGEHLYQVIRQEPVLALWAACRLPDPLTPDARPSMMRRWARRLATEVGDWFQWPASQWNDQSTTNFDSAAEMTATAVAVAWYAANLADQQGATPEDIEHTYLLGLLHGADDWLESAATGPIATGQQPNTADSLGPKNCLPETIREGLNQIQSGKTTEATGRVRLAIEAQDDPQSVAGGNSTARPSGGGWSKQMRAAVTTAHRQWQSSLAGPAPMIDLPALAQRTQRLDALDAKFDATLLEEKLKSLGELAYGASHEINNPLANISTRAQTMMRDEADPERRRRLATINAQAFRAHEMISDLMLFARPPVMRPEPVDACKLLADMLEELSEQARNQQTDLGLRLTSGPLFLQADPVHLSAALRAVCINALEALGSGGRIELGAAPSAREAAPDEAGNEPEVDLVVSDTGPGIPDDVRRHLFDPFYSGREAGRGLGIGLSKAWRVVTQHGGSMSVDSLPGHGTTITMRLPAGKT